jgi:polar amino acid transport system substrate-binding protein
MRIINKKKQAMKAGLTGGLILGILTSLTCAEIHADEMHLYCNEEAPTNYKDADGALAGFTVDIVKELQRRTGSTNAIEITPWNRAFHEGRTKPNIVLFTASRNAEREEDFHWICHVTTRRSVLFGKANSPLAIDNLEQAKQVDGIGVIHGGNRKQYLEERGFTNLESVKKESHNILKLLAGRIDLVFMSTLEAAAHAKLAGFSFADLEPKFPVYSNDSYIIMSKHRTSADTVIKWKDAAQAIKDDGTFDAIANRWIARIRKEYGIETHLDDHVLHFWKAPKEESSKLNTVRLTLMENSPVMSEHVPAYGLYPRIVKAAFKKQNIHVDYQFLPPARAFESAKRGVETDGTVGWAFSEERYRSFQYSAPIFEGPLVFFHLKSFPFDWSTIDDLKDISIGCTDKNYYGPAFHEALDTGKLTIDISPHDDIQFDKLLNNRIQLFPFNLYYGKDLIKRRYGKETADRFTYHPLPLKTSVYHVLFSRAHPEHENLVRQFNRGLQLLKESGEYNQLLDEVLNAQPATLTQPIQKSISAHQAMTPSERPRSERIYPISSINTTKRWHHPFLVILPIGMAILTILVILSGPSRKKIDKESP